MKETKAGFNIISAALDLPMVTVIHHLKLRKEQGICLSLNC